MQSAHQRTAEDWKLLLGKKKLNILFRFACTAGLKQLQSKREQMQKHILRCF